MKDQKVFFQQELGSFEGEIRFDEPLKKHTYYRIGGPVLVHATPRSLADLKLLSKAIGATAIPYFVMGAGSNVLVSDDGFAGLVIKSSRLNLMVEELASKKLVKTGASVAVSSLLRKASKQGWGGFEFLTGVPGTIGGVVRMNAGTHLGEAKDKVTSVEYFDLEQPDQDFIRVEATDLKFSYRNNHFLPRSAVVYAAEWSFELNDPKKVETLIKKTLTRRKETQPIDFPSCGSVFKNPRDAGVRSWEVIDRLGLRGHRIGDAQFSEKHPNFILNHGKAQAREVKQLIDLAKNRALKELNINLEEEVRYLGFY